MTTSTARAAGLDLNKAEMAELKKSAAGVAQQTEKVNNNYELVTNGGPHV